MMPASIRPPGEIIEQGKEAFYTLLKRLGLSDVIEFVLFAVAVSSILVFAVLACRRFPFRRGYCSPLLFLALLPCLIGGIQSYWRAQHVLAVARAWAMYGGNPFERIREVVVPGEFWAVISLIIIGVYSVLYVLSRRSRGA